MKQMKELCNHKTRWIIRKYNSQADYEAGKLFEKTTIEDNILLNAGIGEMWDLICGLGTPTAYDNTNAQLGVGDSTTAEDAAQTDLQASTNKAWVGMESGYPQRSGTTVTFKAVFDGSTANYSWQEFAVRNGASATVLMNRKVSDQGTKASGQVWTLQLEITLS